VINGSDKVIEKDKYDQIYSYCKNNTYVHVTPDTTDHEIIPTGKLYFGSSSGNRFGFDEWNSPGGEQIDKINYISVAAGDSTEFYVKVLADVAYDRYIAVLPAVDHISFMKTGMEDTLDLSAGDNYIKIYAQAGAPIDDPVDLKIYGITDPKRPDCLAGDCYGSDDKLNIVVYNKKVFNNYQLFTDSNFTQSNNQWKTGFNNILKQAVVEMGDQIRDTLNDDWDINGNGILDIFPGYDLINDSIGSVFIDETYTMLYYKDQFGKCYDDNSDTTEASFVFNNPIRLHWVLIEDPVPELDGTVKNLKLGRVNGLNMGDSVRIGPYLGGGNYFRITILIVDNTTNTVTIGMTDSLSSGLPDVLKADDDITIYSDSINGITMDNCSCSRTGLGWDTHVHEFLHQNIVGSLEHINATDNVMYPAKIDRTANKLRYRSQNTTADVPISSQQQWSDLHK